MHEKELIDLHLGISKSNNIKKEEITTKLTQTDNASLISKENTVEKETKPKRSRKKARSST